MRKLIFAIALSLATVFIVGCGDDDDDGLSAADRAWVRQQRLREQYGISGTVTATSTQLVTIHQQNVQTVIVTQ